MRFSPWVGSIVLGLATWACGGSGGSGNSPTAPPPAPTPAPTPAATATTINIVGDRGAQSFSPNPAAVIQGATFSWRNTDNVVHRIVLNDGSLDSGTIAPGASSAVLQLGTDGANYHCTIHPGMVGSINRSAGAPPPCEGPYC
jgi:plastocyanin